MPAKVERCVQNLLKKKNFRPKEDEKKRKSSAYAICTAAQNKKNADAIIEMLSELPDSISIDLDEHGGIKLTENEGIEDEVYTEDPSEDPCYDVFFDESKDEKDPGTFHTFHEISLADNDKKKDKTYADDDDQKQPLQKRIETLREGLFHHWLYGDINFDRKYFMSVIQNFVNGVIDRDVSLDVGHEPWLGAVAWVQKLGLRRREFKDKKKRYVLTADAEFTDVGEEMIAGKRFRYFSIEVTDNFSDKETGEEYGPTMMGGALTNRPYIPGMQPIELSEDVTYGGVIMKRSKTTDGEPAVGGDGAERRVLDEKEEKPNEEVLAILAKLDDYIKQQDIKLQARPPDSQLPDAAFALVKRVDGKVTKRSLPHHGPNVKSATENGSVDVGRLRNALAQINQVKGFTAAEIAAGKKHLCMSIEVLLKSHQKKNKAASENKGASQMDLEQMIAELQSKLDALEDKDSTTAKEYSDQIDSLTQVQAAMEQKIADATKLSEDSAKDTEKKFAEQEAQIKALQESNATAIARLAEADEDRRRAKVELFCEQLEKADHFPATIDVVKKYLFADTDGMVLALSDDDGKEEKYNLMQVFKEILDSVPSDKRVNLTESISNKGDDEPVPPKKEGVVKFGDKEIDYMSSDNIRASLKKAGVKTQEDVH